LRNIRRTFPKNTSILLSDRSGLRKRLAFPRWEIAANYCALSLPSRPDHGREIRDQEKAATFARLEDLPSQSRRRNRIDRCVRRRDDLVSAIVWLSDTAAFAAGNSWLRRAAPSAPAQLLSKPIVWSAHTWRWRRMRRFHAMFTEQAACPDMTVVNGRRAEGSAEANDGRSAPGRFSSMSAPMPSWPPAGGAPQSATYRRADMPKDPHSPPSPTIIPRRHSDPRP